MQRPAMSNVNLFANRLREAHNFVEVGMVTCAMAKQLVGVHHCAVSLNAADGRPVIAVDNLPEGNDELRIAYFERWQHDDAAPKIARAAGGTGATLFTIALPLLVLTELVGVIRCGAMKRFAMQQRDALVAMSLHVSVRFAQLGVTTACESDPFHRLTARQIDAARLVALGHTNAEIASHLGLSKNTVKKHLKLVFERLEIGTRTELAVRYDRLSERDRRPEGVTREGDHTITKLAQPCARPSSVTLHDHDGRRTHSPRAPHAKLTSIDYRPHATHCHDE